MRKMIKTALLSSAIAVAFDSGTPSWKMDGDKIATDEAGNPVYVDSNGKEMAVRGTTIAELQQEAKGHRTGKETAEIQLAKYRLDDGKLIDPAAAKDALDKISKIDAKTLIDAGEVDKVRETIKAEFTGQLAEKDNALKAAQTKIDDMTIDSVFKGSAFIADNVAMPRDFFESNMRGNFKIEEGKVVAYDRSGNRLMSKKSVGEYASSDEALELLVEMHPQKDSILKAPTGNGSGGGGGGGSRGGGRVLTRAQFEALNPVQAAEAAGAMSKGELRVVD